MSEENKNIEEQNAEETVAEQSVTEPTPEAVVEKTQRKVTLTTFICSLVAVGLAAVMLTYTLCLTLGQLRSSGDDASGTGGNDDGQQTGEPLRTELSDEMALIKSLFEYYSFLDIDEDEMRAMVLKAYVAATGDRYAQYFTDEEYAAFVKELEGESQGIGINIIESNVNANGYEYKALKVVNVMADSPAAEAGIVRGDFIVAVGTLDDYVTFNELGYDSGLAALRGEVGTNAQFVVLRATDGGYVSMEFDITRKEFETSYIMSTAVTNPADNTKIGVIMITQFYYDTPTQFSAAVDALRAQGCERFVFDVRYNPGGALNSIVAVLSYFLDEGDTIISVVDNQDNRRTITVGEISGYEGEQASFNVTREDIGKYKDLDMVVLCNSDTASAAELFVANFRDHGIGKVVGTTTFGKGSVQSYVPLYRYGFDGVLKLTMQMYYPPCNESYDGIGITPDVTVELSDEANGKNFYDIFGDLEIDDQLAEAIKHFSK